MSVQKFIVSEVLLKIDDKSFQAIHKLTPKAFTRNRKLTFKTVVGMILRMVKQSLQIACNWLCDCIGIETVSKQAFSKARQKLSPVCFKELYESSLVSYYRIEGQKGLWNGYRIIAVDGSTLRLPESEELAREFGRWPCKEGAQESPPIARISEFTDVTTRIIISGRISPCATSEDALAKEQLIEVVGKMRALGQTKLLFVYDRGYPSQEFIDLHLELGVDFLFRVPKNFNNTIKNIHEKREKETFLIGENIPLLRVSQFTLPGGEDELLLTTLTDEKLYPQESLSQVYQGRWTAMEEGYKRQKITMQLENFSGKTSVAIEQEYWATLTILNIIEMGCVELEGYWIPGKLPGKHVNRSVIFGSMRDATLEAMYGLISADEYSTRFKAKAKRSMIPVRPGRVYSRDGVKKPKAHHVYRRAC